MDRRAMNGAVTKEHEVVVAGGGPTGLMLAAELTLAGIDVVVVERRASQELDGSRAGGLHSRTLEVLDQRGVADRFVTAGQRHPFVGYAGTFLDISDFPTRYNGLLALWQSDFEQILAGWVDELGVTILQESEVVGFVQEDDGVDIELSGGRSLRAEYLVGCDGGRSVVRKAAGIDFPGWDPTSSYMIAEAEMVDLPPMGMRPEGGGIGPVDPQAETGPYRVVLLEPQLEHDREPTLQDLRNILADVYGTDFGVHRPTWISRFTDMCRQASSYRSGRVLIAGDAAHVHGPQGGQGLNTGVQDAVNLGWKLAQVVHRTSPHSLLDTYHAERHPVGARVVRNTMAQVALSRTDERSKALRDATLELLSLDESRARVGGMISGLDIHYDDRVVTGDVDDSDRDAEPGDHAHPLLGRRMPDLDIHTADGTTRVFALLHEARPVLLDLSGADRLDIAPWVDRVRSVAATYDGPWVLPVIGEVPSPSAVLIRPDGYVAWVGSDRTDTATDPDLTRALTFWFGSPSSH